MEIDYSPDAIERRLREVSELVRLAQELQVAGNEIRDARDDSDRRRSTTVTDDEVAERDR